MQRIQRVVAVLLCLALMTANVVMASASSTPSEWAVDQVNAAISEGLVPQNLRTNYTQATTRLEFATLAVTLYEKLKGEVVGRSTFVDTNDVNVQKAAFIGIVAGVGDNRFDPNGTLTREQAAVMLSRLADALDKPLPRQAATFADNAQASSWAIDSIGHVQAGGIMSGIGNNQFSPKAPYTREQSIITIMRLYDIVKPIVPETPTVTPPETGTLTEESVYNAMMALQSQYPDGTRWTEANTYTTPRGDILSSCAAFARMIQDAAFGTIPHLNHRNVDGIRVGDILTIVAWNHDVIVLTRNGDTITVAEGNVAGAVCWGTTFSLDTLKQTGTISVRTRWTE